MLLCKLHEGGKAGLPTGEMENNIYLEGILLQCGSTDQVGPGTRAVEITDPPSGRAKVSSGWDCFARVILL